MPLSALKAMHLEYCRVLVPKFQHPSRVTGTVKHPPPPFCRQATGDEHAWTGE